MIHAVFTNLLLWCNGLISEAKHFLDSHKRRLLDLGDTNITVGKKHHAVLQIIIYIVPRFINHAEGLQGTQIETAAWSSECFTIHSQ